jgi:biotin carboxyl carrier protein
MDSKDDLESRPSVPMTPERAKTSLARCGVAIEKAQRELTEAIRIIDHLAGEPASAGKASERAARALHVAEVQALLAEMRHSAEGAEGLDPLDGRARPPATNGHRRLAPPGDFEGEYPPLSERIVVSPGRGRIHLRRIREGRRLEQDTVIADLRNGTTKTPIRAPVPAVFLSWLAVEGDVVSRGWRLARVLPADD